MKIATSHKFVPVTITIILETEGDAKEFANFCKDPAGYWGQIDTELWCVLPDSVKALSESNN